MIKVYISPMANDGILRVIEAQYEHLPKFGIQPTKNIHEADIICNHGTMLDEVPGIPSVSVGHGLYWSRQPWGDGFMDVNRAVVETMRHAVAWTAPSNWVNTAIRRGGYWYPETIYHGIDGDKFLPSGSNDNYVLWNKARADFVSDPRDVMNIANRMLNTNFKTTIGLKSHNLEILNPMPHQKMKEVVSRAGVYLSTARETFGIGTLEALAYGIPVAGWNWGGNSEIIIQGETGYLAPPGDFKALEECISMCFSERERLSQNGITDARERWRWEPRIEQYANIFKRVYKNWYSVGPKASIIVTAYKLDQYLPACLDSVLSQTFHDFECIVVDDAGLESTRLIVGEYAKRDHRISYRKTPNNFGLPGARNYGLSLSCGKYIRHLDADDFLADNALELEVTALDTDRGVDIVYGHLEVVRPDGSRDIRSGNPVRSGWPEESFKWYHQMAHLNQLPSCVMARREVFERSGGYRERMDRNEDAEFWCRVTSLGFRAKKFTQAVTYFHRERSDSKGATEWQTQGSEPDWTAWFPWRMGTTDFRSASELLRKRGETPVNEMLVPFGAQGEPPKGLRFWHDHDHAYPVVSIIVTVGPGHRHYLIDALDSIQAQNYPDWECVVVNDTGEPWEENIMGAPWAKVVNMQGNQGISAARNEGVKHTRGKFIVWMDADDYWLPWFLERMVSYSENNYGIIYSDILIQNDPKTIKVHRYAPEFQSELVPSTMQYPGSSIMLPRSIVNEMIEKHGGFDSEIVGMEDWAYQIAVHDLGHCAYHIPEPLFVYRMYSSTKREKDYAKIDSIRSYIDSKWSLYRTGEKKLMCGCNKPRTPKSSTPSSMMSASGNFDQQSATILQDGDKTQMVTVEYVGPIAETFTINSRIQRGISYRFGNNEFHRTRSVFLGDAEWLIGIYGRDSKPDYKILSNVLAESGQNDPSAFLGKPITA